MADGNLIDDHDQTYDLPADPECRQNLRRAAGTPVWRRLTALIQAHQVPTEHYERLGLA